MNEPKPERVLPRTRIGTLMVWINTFAIMFITVTAAVGIFVRPDDETIVIHIAMGLGACSIGLFGLVSVMFYLITTGAAIREAMEEHKVKGDYRKRAAALKTSLFPWCGALIIILIATTVVGGVVHVGLVSKWVHIGMTVLTAFVYLKAIDKMKSNFYSNKIIMADLLEAIDAPRR